MTKMIKNRLGACSLVARLVPILFLAAGQGASADVPPGFSPLQISSCQQTSTPSGIVSETVVNLWGREYVVDAAGLPIEILSQGQPVLDAPMRMIFQYDTDDSIPGGLHAFVIEAGAKPFGFPCPNVVAQDDRSVTFSNFLFAMGATVTIETQIEYDGMLRVNLDLAAFSANYDLHSFHYELDMPEEVAELYHHHVPYNFQVLNIDKDQYVSSAGKVPASGALLRPFVPSFFVGNDQVGLEWWTETNGSVPPGPPFDPANPALGAIDPAKWTNTWTDDVDPDYEASPEIENPISLSREQVGTGGSTHEVVRLRVAPLPQPLVKPWSVPRPVRVTTPDTDADLPGSPPGFQGILRFHHEFALIATPMREEGLFPESANAPTHPHRTVRYAGSANFTGQMRMDTMNRYYAILFLDRSHPKNTGLPEPELLQACNPTTGQYPLLPTGGSSVWGLPRDCPSLGLTHRGVVETFHALPEAQRPRIIHYSALARAPGLGDGAVNAQVGIDPDPASAFQEDDSFTKFTWANRLKGRGDIRGEGADAPAIRRHGFYPGAPAGTPPIPGNLGSDWSYFPCFDENEVAEVVLEVGGPAVPLTFGEYLLDRVLHGLLGEVDGDDGTAFPVAVGGFEETVPRRGLDGLYFDFGNLSRHCPKRAIDYWHDWPETLPQRPVGSSIQDSRRQVWNYFEVRQFFKGLYEEVKDAATPGEPLPITVHMASAPKGVSAFMDAVFVGEPLFPVWKNEAEENEERYAPDYLALPDGFLTALLAPRAGGPVYLLPQIGKSKGTAIEPTAQEYEAYFNGMTSLLLSNDWSYWLASLGNDAIYNASGQHIRLWKMLDLLPELGNADFRRVSAPAPGADGVTLTAYVAPSEDRVLVVAANLGSNPLSGITLDVGDAAIGLSGSGLDRYLSLDEVRDTCAFNGSNPATRPTLYTESLMDFGNTSGDDLHPRHIGCLSSVGGIVPQVLSGGSLPVVGSLDRGEMRLFLLCIDGQSCAEAVDLPHVARLRFNASEPGPEWFDTQENSSGTPIENSALFDVEAYEGNNAFHTASSEAQDTHSQFAPFDEDAETWTDYEVRGRMLISSSSSGIGVTAYGYTGVGSGAGDGIYYRLRRHSSSGHREFELTMGGQWQSDLDVVCDQDSSTLDPIPGEWVRFLLQVQERETGDREVRAKVWYDGDPEPTSWAMSCSDSRSIGHPDRPVAGTFGVWSYKSGEKYWDDLEVAPLGRQKF